MKKVAIIMGSDSDMKIAAEATKQLDSFNIEYEVFIMSAHRSPDLASDFAKTAIEQGFGVIIACAGKAAHLAGVLAAYTVLPVIGVPVKSTTLDGLDALLSTVQMPQGVPVATVAIDGAANAGLLAVQILALSEPSLTDNLISYKKEMADTVEKKNNQINKKITN